MTDQDLADQHEVEFIDQAAPGPSKDSAEHIDTGGPSRLGTVVGLVAVAVVAVLVIGSNNNDAPPSITPTTEPAPTTEPELTSEEQLEADLGVAIGDGPGLTWQRLNEPIETSSFSWTTDGFVADDGAVEWTISLQAGQADTAVRPSLRAAYPDYRTQAMVGGERLLVPDQPIPDHVLVINGSGEADAQPVRIDISSLDSPQNGDLVEAQRWLTGSVVGKRLVLGVSESVQVSIPALAERLDLDLEGVLWVDVGSVQLSFLGNSIDIDSISYEDAGLSDDEIQQLRSADTFGSRLLSIDLETGAIETPDLPEFDFFPSVPFLSLAGLTLVFSDNVGRASLATTSDGLTWEIDSVGTERWLAYSGTQLFDFGGSSSSGDRSTDGGQTWDSTRLPLEETDRVVAGDVIFLGRPWNSWEVAGGVNVDTNNDDDYYLVMFDSFSRFELRSVWPFEEPILSGSVDDRSSGAEWTSNGELVFTNPDTGVELARASRGAAQAAAARANPMDQLAMARWPADVDDPEWLVTSPTDLFGDDALSVDFISGGTNVLAVVTKARGFDFYIADTTEEP